MEQLLERQWDHGSNLLMANAHFDVAQLFSCLFQLKSENFRLEENLSQLRKRRDHLYTLNSKLAEVNVLDVPKRQKEFVQQNQDAASSSSSSSACALAKEPKVESMPPTAIPLPANHNISAGGVHNNTMSEDVKPSLKAASANRKSAPLSMPTPVPYTNAPVSMTASSTPSLATIQNNSLRSTPSTVGAPVTSTAAPGGVLTAVSGANEMAMSPERISNQINQMSLYNRLPISDPNFATQLQLLAQFGNNMNTNIFSRILNQNPALVALMNHGPMPPTAVTPLPPTSATPNGK
uniref:Uncharacterized protein n=1 Tax=Caenorhabditis japonica TaxID=281687 RepID=A0A8R1E803_CAEJA